VTRTQFHFSQIAGDNSYGGPHKLAFMTKTVLIVDDNEHLREILAAMLKYSGYEIVEAATGSEAIQKAAVAQPNLILLDLDLPDIKGFEVAKRIKATPTTSHIPIIACSASSGLESRDEALQAGMVEYLQKPIPFSVMMEIIEKFILTDR
jgi:CheY-like chemotaxis protein